MATAKKTPAPAAVPRPSSGPTSTAPKAAPKALTKHKSAKPAPAKPPVAKGPAGKAPLKKSSVKKTTAKAPLSKALVPAQVEKAAPAPKPKKPKLVRDSFTIPKAEYLVLDALKVRATKLTRPAKKSELLRAGIKALAAMSDAAFLTALEQVPAIKTGRPMLEK